MTGLGLTVTEEVKRRVGQHFVLGFHGYDVSDDIKTLIQKYYIGNVILMKRNVQSAAQTKRLVDALQTLAREAGQEQPMMIGIDQENGLVSAFSSPTAGTTFPGAMALGATGSVELAESIAKASADELSMVGINWVYGPVADVNTDSRNPVIGVRSFGDDPEKVAKYVVATARGHAAGGVASCGKHFPGHGDTHVDSHLALPVIRKTHAELAAQELVPFRALVDARVPSIMTGHMALPLVTGDESPASLAGEVTRGLLRGEMGYEGVVVTDCLEMDAVADVKQGGCGIEEGAVRALEAGADVVMICHTFARQVGAVKEVYEALWQGRITLQALEESEVRVRKMKEVFGKQQSDEGDWGMKFMEMKMQNEDVSRKAYLQSTTVVWNGAGVIPLKVDTVVLFTPEPESVNRAVDSGDGVLKTSDGVVRNTAAPYYLSLAKSLEKSVNVRHVVYAAGQEPAAVGNDEGVIFVMRNADLRAWQIEYLDKLVENIQVPLVLLSSCGPYDLGHGAGERFADWTGYVATYEFTAEALDAAAGVILGTDHCHGKLPVVVG
ncbi:Beta-hexosaminidase [Psilocybe cubensis]|uniref:Glycoside hydrolase family 3 N-terminal domain-containing protein n=2 Tax=Psilocybe cubensis TaxID=181762 RepID=A0A8H8CFA6_PSICU|nr:Beta-hexosaminidase [Psilocybe cubensis]KAH9477033.1 Beta-hexosaminidase [Psilocybe cubensis]